MVTTLSKAIGSGNLPPISIDVPANIPTLTINTAQNMHDNIGGLQSATVTSASLTEVLNISGSGNIDFLALHPEATINVNPAAITVTIDGVEVVNESGINFSGGDQSALFILGCYSHDSFVAFNSKSFRSSLVVEISGDGTNPVRITYKTDLT